MPGTIPLFSATSTAENVPKPTRVIFSLAANAEDTASVNALIAFSACVFVVYLPVDCTNSTNACLFICFLLDFFEIIP